MIIVTKSPDGLHKATFYTTKLDKNIYVQELSRQFDRWRHSYDIFMLHLNTKQMCFLSCKNIYVYVVIYVMSHDLYKGHHLQTLFHFSDFFNAGSSTMASDDAQPVAQRTRCYTHGWGVSVTRAASFSRQSKWRMPTNGCKITKETRTSKLRERVESGSLGVSRDVRQLWMTTSSRSSQTQISPGTLR